MATGPDGDRCEGAALRVSKGVGGERPGISRVGGRETVCVPAGSRLFPGSIPADPTGGPW